MGWKWQIKEGEDEAEDRTRIRLAISSWLGVHHDDRHEPKVKEYK